VNDNYLEGNKSSPQTKSNINSVKIKLIREGMITNTVVKDGTGRI
jgi:hypothetical protein